MRADRIQFSQAVLACLIVAGAFLPIIGAVTAKEGAMTLEGKLEGNQQLQVDGLVLTPMTYQWAALAALPRTGVSAGSISYSGVPLWELLKKAGLITHPEFKNEILRQYVTAVAGDGYKIVISLGEIDPDFGNQPCLIALQQTQDGVVSGGFMRLIFPNDVKKGRWVHDLTELKVTMDSN